MISVNYNSPRQIKAIGLAYGGIYKMILYSAVIESFILALDIFTTIKN